MLGIGFGYKFRDFELNVSYTPRIAFTDVFSVSLNCFFGETKERRREEQISALLVEALDHFREGDYENALSAIDAVLELDPRDDVALSLKKSIEELNSIQDPE
jgi:hypothetical protein